MDFWTLIEVLEASVEKHGPDKPVTLGHLLNLLKYAEKKQDEFEDLNEAIGGAPEEFF